MNKTVEYIDANALCVLEEMNDDDALNHSEEDIVQCEADGCDCNDYEHIYEYFEILYREDVDKYLCDDCFSDEDDESKVSD